MVIPFEIQTQVICVFNDIFCVFNDMTNIFFAAAEQ